MYIFKASLWKQVAAYGYSKEQPDKLFNSIVSVVLYEIKNNKHKFGVNYWFIKVSIIFIEKGFQEHNLIDSDLGE